MLYEIQEPKQMATSFRQNLEIVLPIHPRLYVVMALHPSCFYSHALTTKLPCVCRGAFGLGVGNLNDGASCALGDLPTRTKLLSNDHRS